MYVIFQQDVGNEKKVGLKADMIPIISSKCIQCLFVGFSFAFILKASYLFKVFQVKVLYIVSL